jgi:WD40 repeat protein
MIIKSPHRIALIIAAVAVVVAGGLVALHIAVRPAPALDYSHLHLVWTPVTAGTGEIVRGVAFSPDGNTLAVAGSLAAGGNDVIELWNVSSHHLTTRLPCDDGSVADLAFSPDGRVLAAADTCAGDPAVQLWDTATHRLITALSAGPDTFLGKYVFLTLAFSPDGHTLAAGATATDLAAGAVEFWNMSSHRIVGQVVTSDSLLNIEDIAYSPDGRNLVSSASGGDGPAYNATQLWDTSGYRLVGTLGHQLARAVAFSPDGRTVAVADISEVAQLWDVAGRRQVRSLIDGRPGANAAFEATAFSPDGRVLAAGDTAGTLTLWDAADGRVITTQPCHCVAHQVGFQSLAFSPHGDLLAAAAGYNGIVDVWSVG